MRLVSYSLCHMRSAWIHSFHSSSTAHDYKTKLMSQVNHSTVNYPRRYKLMSTSQGVGSIETDTHIGNVVIATALSNGRQSGLMVCRGIDARNAILASGESGCD